MHKFLIDLETLREIFEEYCKSEGISDREFARRAKVDAATLYRIMSDESPNPKAKNLEKIWNVLKDRVGIPYYGVVNAGKPALYDESSAKYWDLNDKFTQKPGATFKRKPGTIFIVKAAGDSMVDENIFDGDYLVAERIQAGEAIKNGTVIICDTARGVCVKKYYKEKDDFDESVVWLRSANKRYEDFPADESFELLGRVISIYRYLS